MNTIFIVGIFIDILLLVATIYCFYSFYQAGKLPLEQFTNDANYNLYLGKYRGYFLVGGIFSSIFMIGLSVYLYQGYPNYGSNQPQTSE